MPDYKSNFQSDRNMQIETYNGTATRSNSASSSYSYAAPPPPPPPAVAAPPQKLKKGKSTGGSISKTWSLNDPEVQRKKRVASYKVYSVEGKVKGSFRKSFRWLKDRYTQVVYGWWD